MPNWQDVILKLCDEPYSKPCLKHPKPTYNNGKFVFNIKLRDEGLLWVEMLNCLYKLKKNKEIISFPTIFEGVCTKFSMTKAKAWNCLFFLAEFGLIEVVKGHGVKLNYEMGKTT